MPYSSIENRLMSAMSEMKIIDCHEHLPPEPERTSSPQDVFTLFSHYTRHDLFSSGMDRAAYDGQADEVEALREYNSLFDYDVPLEQRWRRFRPYWQRIRYGSYARAALLTAKMVYAIDDISDSTYAELSERIAAENTPGIYRRILCDRCNIQAALTQCGSTGVDKPLVPLMPAGLVTALRTAEQTEKLTEQFGVHVTDLDSCRELVRTALHKWRREGAVGIKIMSQYNEPADAKAAAAALKRLLNGEELQPTKREFFEPLYNYLLHQALDMAAELEMVVAVHAGIWGDYRNLDCKDMLTLAPTHPRTNFDLYHLGMPSARDAIVVAKNLPNVHLNLCWTHIISQAQTCSAIDELIDQVPVNKVLAFGGDYRRPVEKVVGHLHMAREDLARVFAGRIERGLLSIDQAIELLRTWFWDNPLALYRRLSV